jgi:putative redox protein
VAGDATREQLEELVARVDAIAEIPNSLRLSTEVKLAGIEIASSRP